MDNLLQDNEMQDEELYALLDKALETDSRLCVSEELIQKTLKRAAEEKDTKVVSFEAAAKKKLSPMKYMGIAVAAVFVAVLGVNAFGNGGLLADKAQMEATADRMERKTNEAGFLYDGNGAGIATADSADAPENKSYHNRAGNEPDSEAETQTSVLSESPKENQTDNMKSEDMSEVVDGAVEMSATTVKLSERVAGVLKDAGMAPVFDDAECWEFADTEADWERELLNCLAAGVLWGNQPPEYGAYRYVLTGKENAQYVMEYNEPLDLIVRIETEQGTLWGLLGAGGFWVLE